MGIFNKNKENKFKEPGDISGGNLYEKFIERQAQKEIDVLNINNRINNNIDNNIENLINNQTLPTYYLFELQANYFINTINYETKDIEIFKKIKLLLRVAFKNGKAALYKQNDQYIVAGVNDIKYNIYGDIEKINITPINESNVSFNESEYKKLANLNIDDVNNVVIFKWSSSGISGWATIYKFCIIQNELLEMISTDKYSYIKKLVHIVNDPSANNQEVIDYFNTKKPFLKRLRGVDLTNRIEISEVANKQNPNLLCEYYKQICGIYYAIYGRRMNNDFKKERSLNKEVSLTGENYDILEKEWIDQFYIFTQEVKNKFNIDITLIKEQEKEQSEIEVEAIDDFSRDMN